jgi:hypothetical protein
MRLDTQVIAILKVLKRAAKLLQISTRTIDNLKRDGRIDAGPASQVETKGFSGSECLEASKFIEQALGKQTDTRTTAEFFSSSVNQNTIQNSNGS